MRIQSINNTFSQRNAVTQKQVNRPNFKGLVSPIKETVKEESSRWDDAWDVFFSSKDTIKTLNLLMIHPKNFRQ